MTYKCSDKMSAVKIKAVQQAISMMNSVSGTIKATVQAVNMAWGDEESPLPVNEYHRRAHLIADLEIVLSKLIDEAHNEALEMDAQRDIDNMVEEGGAIQAQIDFYAMPFDSQRAALVRASYREALQINDRVSVELSRFKAAATGIMKSTFTADAKRQMVMAACSGLLVGIKHRLGIQLNPHALSRLWGDHREQSI